MLGEPSNCGSASVISNHGAFEPDEDVHRRTDSRFIHERAHGDVHVATFPHEGIEQRAAGAAVQVVAFLVAVP